MVVSIRFLLFSLLTCVVAPLAGADPLSAQGRRQLLESFAPSAQESGIAVAFFDVDGTLRPAARPGAPVDRPEEVFLLPHVASRLGELARQGYFIALISNQGGIPRFLSFEQAQQTLFHTVKLIRRAGGSVHMMDFAESYDDNRKPGTGMGRRVEAFLNAHFGKSIDRSRSLMVGDSGWSRARNGVVADTRPDGRAGFSHSNADRKFAEAFGVPFFEAADFFGWREKYQVEGFESLRDLHRFYERHAVADPHGATRECLRALLK